MLSGSQASGEAFVFENKTLTLADTDYSHNFYVPVLFLKVKARGGIVKMKKVGVGYLTIADGESEDFHYCGFLDTLKFQSPTAGAVVEIVSVPRVNL